jgi:hypothetical protein
MRGENEYLGSMIALVLGHAAFLGLFVWWFH